MCECVCECVRSKGDEIHISARDSICTLIFHTSNTNHYSAHLTKWERKNFTIFFLRSVKNCFSLKFIFAGLITFFGEGIFRFCLCCIHSF